MARVIGGQALSGAVGNVVYYQMNGKTYCRQKAYISPSSIKKSPSRKKQRQTMSEFGFASCVGKLLRFQMYSSPANAMGPNTSQQLTGRIVPIVRDSKGDTGMRSTEISKHGKHLKGFEFHEGRNPNAHFSHAPNISHAHNFSDTQISLYFPPQTRHKRKEAHEEATHYIIHLNVTQIPDYHTDLECPDEQYPTDSKQEPITQNAQSAPIPIGQKPGADGTLTVALPTPNNEETSHIVSYGIEYLTRQGDEYENIVISKPRARKRQNDAYMVILEVIPTATEYFTTQISESKTPTQTQSGEPIQIQTNSATQTPEIRSKGNKPTNKHTKSKRKQSGNKTHRNRKNKNQNKPKPG